MPTKNKHRQRRKPPFVLRWLRFSFRLQSLISTRWAGWRLYRLWFTSPKHPEPRREQAWREGADFMLVANQYGPIATYTWGDGQETVLLLHGWSGRGPQMGAFVKPLLDKGYRVVAFDAPGHGRSPGKSSTIFKMYDALQSVIHELGPARAVIAHSFGSMLLAYALKQGTFTTDKAVCISSPTSPVFLVDRFCQIMQINDPVKQQFMRHTEKAFDKNIWDNISADKNAINLAVPALIIHDKDDHDVPYQLGQQLADAWPAARFHLTQGLGHRRILRNRDVINTVVEFVG